MLLAGAALLVVVAIAYSFMPRPVTVRTMEVTRGPLQVIVEEEGETRVEDRYVVTAPVAGFARRVEVEVGDRVVAGQPLVRLEPARAALLDAPGSADAAARADAARARLGQADVVAARATAERERVERLVAADAATRQALEQAIADEAGALAALRTARAELDAAAAALRGDAAVSPGVRHVVTAPASGTVLAVHRRSEGQVAPGEPLVDIGTTDRLEVVADVLSQDAVSIAPGTPALLDEWGGDVPLDAVVTRVEPHGFMRVSALGVEERRVSVVAALRSPPELYARLGAGYRVLARFIVWQHPDVARVPTAALFRYGDGWAVFAVDGGRAVRKPVEIGRQAGLLTEVVRGLAAGDTVIVHPSSEVDDGKRVRAASDD
jgi:HlyD family secretion protein